MRNRAMRVFCVVACLLALAGCSSSPVKLGGLMPGGQDEAPPPPPAAPEAAQEATAEAIEAVAEEPAAS